MGEKDTEQGKVPELEVENTKTGMPKDMGERPEDVKSDPLDRPDEDAPNTQTFRDA